MSLRTLDCIGNCGLTLDVYADNVIAFICKKCNVDAPRGSIICDTCLVRAIKADKSVGSITCSHCTQTRLLAIRNIDRAERSRIRPKHIKLAMKKSNCKTYQQATIKIYKNTNIKITPIKLGQNARGNIQPPDRCVVDWVESVLSEQEIDSHEDIIKQTNKDPKEIILSWFEQNKGWFNKSEILNGYSVNNAVWNNTIRSLLNKNILISKGKKRGTKYNLKDSA